MEKMPSYEKIPTYVMPTGDDMLDHMIEELNTIIEEYNSATTELMDVLLIELDLVEAFCDVSSASEPKKAEVKGEIRKRRKPVQSAGETTIIRPDVDVTQVLGILPTPVSELNNCVESIIALIDLQKNTDSSREKQIAILDSLITAVSKPNPSTMQTPIPPSSLDVLKKFRSQLD